MVAKLEYLEGQSVDPTRADDGPQPVLLRAAMNPPADLLAGHAWLKLPAGLAGGFLFRDVRPSLPTRHRSSC